MDGNKKKIPIIATVTALLIICAVLVVFFIQKNKAFPDYSIIY